MIGSALSWRSTGFRSAAATTEPPRRFWFFFLFERSEGPLERSKITPTTSSPEAWLVTMSRSSLVVHGPLHPNLWTRDSQVVPDRKALMTSTLATLGSSLHYQEKHWMYSWRVSPDFCWQFFKSHGFLGHV